MAEQHLKLNPYTRETSLKLNPYARETIFKDFKCSQFLSVALVAPILCDISHLDMFAQLPLSVFLFFTVAQQRSLFFTVFQHNKWMKTNAGSDIIVS